MVRWALAVAPEWRLPGLLVADRWLAARTGLNRIAHNVLNEVIAEDIDKARSQTGLAGGGPRSLLKPRSGQAIQILAEQVAAGSLEWRR